MTEYIAPASKYKARSVVPLTDEQARAVVEREYVIRRAVKSRFRRLQPDDLEDLMGEAMLEACRVLPSWDPAKSALSTWLVMKAMYAAANWVRLRMYQMEVTSSRRRKPPEPIVSIDAEMEDGIEFIEVFTGLTDDEWTDQIADADVTEACRQAASEMGQKYELVFIARFDDFKTQQQAAKAAGVSISRLIEMEQAMMERFTEIITCNGTVKENKENVDE